MRLWTLAAIALTICGSALCYFLSSFTVTAKTRPFLPSSSSSSGRNPRRRTRSAVAVNSFLADWRQMFQSFSEGELRQLIGRLVDRKQRREARESGRRPKRAGRGSRPCTLRQAEVTVSQLGLGYRSDETLLFHYCTGTCRAKRRNYDVIMKSWTGKGMSRKSRAPCCRPTEYEEDFSFLDDRNHYKTLSEWSAMTCGCV
ncbi:neurturin [Aplochiton taeniatus]